MKIVLILGFILLAFNKETAGRIRSKIYDFKNFNMVNFHFLLSEEDQHPQKINKEGIQDIVYSLRKNTKTECTQRSIACIKYTGDPKYYAMTPVGHLFRDADENHNVSFDELDRSFTLRLPKSNEEIGSGETKRNVQLLIKFKCSSSDKNESTVSEIEPSTYLLEISSSELCPHRFDYISHAMFILRYVIGGVLIFSNFFLLIPYPFNQNDKNTDNNRLNYAFNLSFQLGITSSLTFSLALYNYLSIFIVFKIILICVCFITSMLLPFALIIRLNKKNLLQYLVCFLSSIVMIMIIFNFILVPLVAEHKEFIAHLLYIILIVTILTVISFFIQGDKVDSIREIFKMFVHVFLFVRGIAAIVGWYPNELIIELMKESKIKYPLTAYFYLIPIIGYPILAFIFKDKLIFNIFRNKNPFFSQKAIETIKETTEIFRSKFGVTEAPPGSDKKTK